MEKVSRKDHTEKRPQGDSNPRYRRERAMSLTGLDDGDIYKYKFENGLYLLFFFL